MATPTLLEIVQDTLSSTDSDEVNNINDTVESQQVVRIVKTVYNDIISRSDLTAHKTLFNLDSSADVSKPVLMTKPSTITNIDWIKYDCEQDDDTDPVWRDVRYMRIEDFVCMVQQLKPTETNVESFSHTANGFTFAVNYRNDIAPCYFTSFDDNTILFDSYDAEVDTILQSSKTLCFGQRNLSFVESNTFIPELPPDQFTLLLQEVKSLAWAELKQMPHAKAEQSARRGWRHLAKSRRTIPNARFPEPGSAFNNLPYFGRI